MLANTDRDPVRHGGGDGLLPYLPAVLLVLWAAFRVLF